MSPSRMSNHVFYKIFLQEANLKKAANANLVNSDFYSLVVYIKSYKKGSSNRPVKQIWKTGTDKKESADDSPAPGNMEL